ncbi:MAG: outer membrane beta-barrel protein [Woeseiaceae bacterium]|nr:outer membrane beta-barrel protein [Woeseiaceae bacterium]
MCKTVRRTIISCAVLLGTGDALAGADDWPLFNARPVLGYMLFGESFLHGNLADATPVRTKKEDLVGGIAASFSVARGDWRAELEYAWRARTDANGYVYGETRTLGIRNNLQNQTITGNLRRYWQPRRGVTPYLTAGYGLVRHESVAEYLDVGGQKSLDTGTRVEANTTWNAGAGIEFTTDSGWIIDLGYRYVHLGRARSPAFGAGFAFATGELVSHDFYFAIARTR